MDKNIANIIFYHSLIVFGELMIVISLIHMLYKKRSPASIIAWLLSMVLMPYLFVFLYFIFGSRKHINRYKKDNIRQKNGTNNTLAKNPVNEILNNSGIFKMNSKQKFKIFSDPVSAYDIFIKSINNSTKSICISTYVLKYDKTAKEILDALCQKAKEGVRIKILIDTLGSWQLYFTQHKLKKYKNSGIKIEFFMPILKMPFRNYINLRDHRKIYIFDNKRVLSGGMNIADEYMGKDKLSSRWEDILFFCEGSSVKDFFEVFASDWLYASSKKIDFSSVTFEDNADTDIQVVPSGPDMEKDAVYEALLYGIYNSKSRIWIVTPYFVPNDSLSQALIIAKHKGIDVKLITPKNSNHLIADLTRSSFMRDLEDEGVEVWLYKGNMLHAKAVIFDDDAIMLGSINFDNRSLFLNYDIATFVYTKSIIDDVAKWMKELINNSEIGTKKVSKFRIIMENFMRIFAPVM